jgi:hypothetical protein
MTPEKTAFLIVKYLTKEASFAEMDILSEWVKDPKNKRVFDQYVKIHYEITATMNEPDIESIKKNLLKKIKEEKGATIKTKYWRFFRYAAVFVLLIGVGYWLNESRTKKTGIVLEQPTKGVMLVPKEDSITLDLEDGTVQKINTQQFDVILNTKGHVIGNQSGKSITYSNTSKTEVLEYNTLTIPKGKKFELTLSDGTHIFLNAASTLRYPVKFVPGLPREVFITGEGYFNVAKDEKHPFIVNTGDMQVEVLGTKFNVSNYPENDDISTVLVEGSVKLDKKGGGSSSFLDPGFKAEWNRIQNSLVSKKNVNTRLYTAWTEGKLIFRNATFKHIRHTLERHYNVDIINNNADLEEQRFDATFDIETINDILQAFTLSYAIDFKIEDNKAIID